MTNVAVIGATSRIALWADRMLANKDGINLTLFVHHISKLPQDLKDASNVTVIEGDATNADDIAKAVAGQDVVYASLAGKVIDQAHVLVEQMDKAGVKRLIWTSSLGIDDEVPGEFGRWNKAYLGDYLTTYHAAAQVIQKSDLDYTIVRPAWLTDEDNTEFETTSENRNEPFKGTQVSRKATAAYIVSVIEDPSKDVRDSIGVNQPGTDGDRPPFLKK
jgi:uncharacterized protein YbjT (DUF2867 family)